jgi:hypothetical protein
MLERTMSSRSLVSTVNWHGWVVLVLAGDSIPFGSLIETLQLTLTL